MPVSWLNDVLALFSDTLNAVASVPVLRFFLLLVLVLSAGTFAMTLIQQGRKGKL